MKKRNYPDWFVNELAHEEDKEKARNGKLTSKDFVDFFCQTHGIYNQYIGSHIKLSTGEKVCGCPECSKLERAITQKKTYSEKRKEYPLWFISEISNNEDREKAINGTLSSGDKIEFNCPIHGKYSQFVYSHIKISTGERLHGCPKCGITNQTKSHKQTKFSNKKDFPLWFIDDLAYKEDKERAKQKNITADEILTFLCKEHGEYKQSVGHHIKISTGEKRNGCPICAKIERSYHAKETWSKKRPVYPEWFINDLANEEDKIKASKNLISSGDVVEFVCKKHGIYKQPVYNHIILGTADHKAGCPKCGIQISKSENALFEIIKNVIPNTIKNCKTEIRNPDTGYPLELDIYCKDKKIAFEYNGSKWHNENIKDDCSYHLKKFKLCEEKGIRLISIFDKDWIYNYDKIKSFIENTINKKTKIYGRMTTVKKIQTNQANDFCKKYHIKGYGNGCNIAYGLFYKDELISVMTFSKPKFGKQKDVEWDLKRYCIKHGYIVLGGASKLFSSFIKEYKPKKIITYSDCDYFTGEIYKLLGFTFDGYTTLPYYWTNGNAFHSREQCQVKILKDKYPDLYKKAICENASSKEDFIMHSLGFYKVFRCGNKKWIWKK